MEGGARVGRIARRLAQSIGVSSTALTEEAAGLAKVADGAGGGPVRPSECGSPARATVRGREGGAGPVPHPGGLVVDAHAQVLRPDGTPIRASTPGGAAEGISGHGAAGISRATACSPRWAWPSSQPNTSRPSMNDSRPPPRPEGGPMLDLLIKNVIVVTTEDGAFESQQRLDLGIEDGSSPVEPTSSRRTLPRSSTVGAPRLPGVVDAHQHWASTTRWRRTRSRRAGPVRRGCHDRHHLHADGPVLPEPDRAPTGSSSLVLEPPRVVLRGLRLPPGADDARAHRRDPFPHHGVRRSVLQDLHVLRQPWTAWQVPGPERLPHDPAGERYDLAHFEFVMRGIQKAREALPRSPTRSPCRCTARPRRS